jgi:hypothetical protein
VLTHSNHPNWWTEPSRRYHKNFIGECIEAEKYIVDIVKFVCNIYRISNNNTNVSNEIQKLLQKYSLDDNFIELIDKGYSLNPILNLIFDDKHDENKNNFKDDRRLFLLKHCFCQKKEDNKTYTIAENKAKTKLDALLVFAKKEKSNEVYSLLESLIEQERYKNIISNLIIAKDSEFINGLPQKLLELAVSSFKKENSNDFADNFEFLSVIMQNGTKTQKGYIISILTAKLDNNSDIDKVLSFIETIEDVSSFDSNGVLHSHLGKYQEDNKEQISEDVNKKIKQLTRKSNDPRRESKTGD